MQPKKMGHAHTQHEYTNMKNKVRFGQELSLIETVLTFNTSGLMDNKLVCARVVAIASGYCMYCDSNKLHRIATHEGR